MAKVAEFVLDILLGTMKGPTFFDPLFFPNSEALYKFIVEGPPEPTIMPVISFDISISSKPESSMAFFIAI